MPFSDDQSRLLVNLSQQYGTWIDAARTLDGLAYGMAWKPSGGQDYLYAIADRKGNATSVGPRSARTEAAMTEYQQRKREATGARDGAAERLDESARMYRALRLPMIPA